MMKLTLLPITRYGTDRDQHPRQPCKSDLSGFNASSGNSIFWISKTLLPYSPASPL
ncbi:MAG: hypothetical protein JO235_11880 [Chroococcidiopsidaceae cyanobacterium CP_BM_RX_35]|nr:hypothetical protein [Chroococcidiopsidaceae cyanobacterium CP_BM_RX_35]